MKMTVVNAPTRDLACPGCEAPLTGAAHPDSDEQPRPGDLSICIYCAELLQFTDTLGLKRLSDDEIKLLPKDSQEEILVVMRQIKKRQPN